MHSTTSIPNSLFDTYLPQLKPAELKVLLVIIRKTIGWQKDRDWISTQQFSNNTGLSRKAISTAITSLQSRGIIRVSDYNNQPLVLSKSRQNSVRIFYSLSPLWWVKTTHSRVHISSDLRKKFSSPGKKVRTTKETSTKETLQRIEKIKAELKARWGRPQ